MLMTRMVKKMLASLFVSIVLMTSRRGARAANTEETRTLGHTWSAPNQERLRPKIPEKPLLQPTLPPLLIRAEKQRKGELANQQLRGKGESCCTIEGLMGRARAMADSSSANRSLRTRRKPAVKNKRRRPLAGPVAVFLCNVCEKEIRHYWAFREHQFIHTGERRYMCKTCGKNFVRSSDLIKHRLVHSDKRPHSCSECGKGFKLAGDLSKHQQVHLDVFPFPCDHCKKRFKRADCLVKHLRIHTSENPFSCDACPRRFKWESSLREHRRLHTGEKPYKCAVCDKSFTHRSTFIQHKRTHENKKPFTCSHCPASFNHKSNALKHERRVHA